tara:strand:+ start:1974 stop:4247 length:2274 start_codon:yes stop_codon:yes gene_type:complete
MYIITIFICIIIFAVILFNLVKLLINPNQELYKKFLDAALYIIAFATLLNVLIATYSFVTTKDKIAKIGDKGMKGPSGEKGRDGICDDKCGQKVCYVSVIDHANKIFREKIESSNSEPNTTKPLINHEIRNTYFKNKINNICSSKQYQDIITQKFKKRPNEDTLIKYLKKIIEEWVLLFLKFNPTDKDKIVDYYGVKFLKSKNLTPDLLDVDTDDESKLSPLRTIEKYDIWGWSNDKLMVEPLVEKVTSQNIVFPTASEPELFIIKTNNYNRVYHSTMKKDKWSDSFCEYNQMGPDLTNPNNLKKCIYINPNNKLKEYKNTWKTDQYIEPSELSIYNVKMFKNKNNQIFYPLGSVWRGKVSDERSDYSKRLPKSQNKCGLGHGEDQSEFHTNKGPEKETILVSGNVVDPVDYKMLWDSTVGCPECQESSNHIKIFRPIPPEGYICLGDVAGKTIEEVKALKIKCVPENALRKFKLGPKVWQNKDVRFAKFDNYTNFANNKPYFHKKPISFTLWSAGASNVFEENKNNINIRIEDDGGYNLFRVNAGKGFTKKPSMSSYVIKQEYLMFGKGNSPRNLKLQTKASSGDRYSDNAYFGIKPSGAVITNIQELGDENKNKSINNIENQPKRMYLIDDSKRRKDNKPDTYFLKTYNENKNDFSSCVVTNFKSQVSITPKCDKNNKYHIWTVNHNTDDTTNTENVQLKSTGDFYNNNILTKDKCLTHYYNSLGKSVYELKNCDEIDKNMRYDTFVKSKLPKSI